MKNGGCLVFLVIILGIILSVIISFDVMGADTNTVSSTVVTDKSVPTANAPSVVINNSDVCRSGMSVGAQTGIVGISTGLTITDENCERIKLARSLYFMGMKVAAVSLLCQDARVFDAMTMAGTPCPYKGKIGTEAKLAWEADQDAAPEGNRTFGEKEEEYEEESDGEEGDEDDDEQPVRHPSPGDPDWTE
jgi:hypothetical protein